MPLSSLVDTYRCHVLDKRSGKLVAAEISQLRHFLRELTGAVMQPALASWPGPSTWLWPARASVPRLLRGDHSTLAVRVSAHPVVRELCLEFGGPLVSTSANPAGGIPARSADEVHAFFGDALDIVVSGDIGCGSRPTEIRDLLTGAVLRSA